MSPNVRRWGCPDDNHRTLPDSADLRPVPEEPAPRRAVHCKPCLQKGSAQARALREHNDKRRPSKSARAVNRPLENRN